MALDQRLEEVHEGRIGALDGLVQAVLLLLAEKYGEKKNTAISRLLVQGVGELVELLA